jgi:archaellum component FlaC
VNILSACLSYFGHFAQEKTLNLTMSFDRRVCEKRTNSASSKQTTSSAQPRNVESLVTLQDMELADGPCGNIGDENCDRTVQTLKVKLEEIEPRLGCVGEKLQRVAEEMQKFRELLTVRRREIEDLEAGVHERIEKTEEQLFTQVCNFTENRAAVSADAVSVRKTLHSIKSEVGFLKNWVTENLRQIKARLESRDQAIDCFREEICQRIRKFEDLIAAQGGDVQELRHQVDAKFSAVKAALRKPSRVCNSQLTEILEPETRQHGEPETHLDTVTIVTVGRSNEQSSVSQEAGRDTRPRKCCRKREARNTPRFAEVMLPEQQRGEDEEKPLHTTNMFSNTKKKPCEFPSNKNYAGGMEQMATAATERREFFLGADRILDLIKNDSRHEP